MEQEDHEVDATVFFKREATALTEVRDLAELLEKYGYSKDDNIERRELVQIYEAVRKEMEREIYRLAHTSHYDEAKEMRQRLTKIREEFDAIQTSSVSRSHRDQLSTFEKGSVLLMRNLQRVHGDQLHELRDNCERTRADMLRHHEIQWDNLELEIARIPRPIMKYSKRLIELFKAETGLIRLKQYDDARRVRHMIDKILPGEEKRFYEEFDASIEAKRERLRQSQKADLMRLDEKLTGIEWTDYRRREREASIADNRLKHHTNDMSHAHLMESKLRPEMSVKPSALWQKRPGYERTAASLRGRQLLATVKGRTDSSKVFAETLVDKHDFTQSLEGTIAYTPGMSTRTKSSFF